MKPKFLLVLGNRYSGLTPFYYTLAVNHKYCHAGHVQDLNYLSLVQCDVTADCLDNIPEPNKKFRQIKKSFQASDFQKVERDFAFVIDKNFKTGLLEKIIKEIDTNIIQNVSTFDVYIGENIPNDKKSVAINVTLRSSNKTLSENDLDLISKKIIESVKIKTGATIRS